MARTILYGGSPSGQEGRRFRIEYDVYTYKDGGLAYDLWWYLENGENAYTTTGSNRTFSLEAWIADPQYATPFINYQEATVTLTQTFSVPPFGEHLIGHWEGLRLAHRIRDYTWSIMARRGTNPPAPSVIWEQHTPALLHADPVNHTTFTVNNPRIYDNDGLGQSRLWEWRQSTGQWHDRGMVPSRNFPKNFVVPEDDRVRWGTGTSVYQPGTGPGASIYSQWVWTKPAAATGVNAVRVGIDADVTWTTRARAATRQTLQAQWAPINQTWSGWEDVAGHTNFGPAVTTRRVLNLDPLVSWRFRVVTYVDWPHVLETVSEQSNPVRLIAPPYAPTLLQPQVVTSQLEPVRHEWAHNPMDTTPQTRYEMRHRPAGGSWATHTGNTDQFVELPLPVGSYQWQVRTRGTHADFGPWSDIGGYQVFVPPVVTITSPDGPTIPTNMLVMEWDFEDVQGAGQAEWQAQLVDDTGALLEYRSGGNGTNQVAFSTPLNNSQSVTGRVRSRSGTGLWSEWAQVGVGTDFLLPATPSIRPVWDEPDGVVHLTVNNNPDTVTHLGGGAWEAAAPVTHMGGGVWQITGATITHEGDGVWNVAVDDDSTVPTHHNRVERLDPTGWTVIANDLPVDAVWSDYEAPLNGDVRYRVVAVAVSGTEAASAVSTTNTATNKLWLRPFDGTHPGLWVEDNLQYSTIDQGNHVTAQYWGRETQTVHYQESRTRSMQATGTWIVPEDRAQTIRGLQNRDVLWRDPDSNVIPVVVKTINVHHLWVEEAQVQIAVEETGRG